VLVWVGASLLVGLVGQRVTGRLTIGVAATLVAFGALGVIANEPMHPQGLCVLLIGGITLIVASRPQGGGRRAGIAVGALLGALILTKVNLGSLALVAFVLAAVLTIEPLHRRRGLRLAVIAAFLLLPTVLIARNLDTLWGRELIALELFSTVAVLIAAQSVPRVTGSSGRALGDWVLAALAGLVASCVAILAIIFITGTTPHDVWEGMIVEPWRIARYFTVPFTSPAAAPGWGIAAIAAAALATRLRADSPQAAALWPGLLRVAAGLAIWLTISHTAPLSINPPGNSLALPLVLTWVAMLAPAGLEEEPGRRFLRVFVCFLALAEALQVYPVAGSQVGIASVTFVAVGAICLADGIRQLTNWSAAGGAEALRKSGAVIAVAGIALAGVLAYDLVLRPLANNAFIYSEEPSLALPGANLYHPPAAEGEELTRLTRLVEEHGCTSLIGYANLNSLYLWTGIEPPRPVPPGAWVVLFGEKLQRETLESVRDSPRPCAVRSDALAEEWLQGNPPREGPLVDYILEELESVATVGRYELLVPPGA
jgi:hypothetical protein